MRYLLRLLLGLVIATPVVAQTQYFYQNPSASFNSIPFNTSVNNCRQWLYLSSELNMPTGYIDKIIIQANTAVTPSFTYLIVNLGQTTQTSFTTNSFATGLTNAYFGSFSTTSNALNQVEITLQTPFYFDATQNLIVQCSQSGMTSGFSVMQSIVTGRSVYGQAMAATGIQQDKLALMGFSVTPNQNPLSVNITSLSLNARGESNLLRWSTDNEQNINQYIVERSEDGISFKMIGSVNSDMDGKSAHDYSFVDDHASDHASENLFYRIKVLEKSGLSFYTRILSIKNNLDLDVFNLEASPIPFNDHVSVQFSLPTESSVEIAVTDVTGKRLLQKTIEGKQGRQIVELAELSNLPQGTYFLTAGSSTKNGQIRIIKN